jgi:predicted nucleic acid-binding protein
VSLALYATYFDASALVKRFLNENGSDILRKYWATHTTLYTTPFCLYETLGVLKRHKLMGTLTKTGYFKSCTELIVWYRASANRIKDLDFTRPDVFADAKEIAESHDLDFSDAFQLLSLQAGFFAPLVRDSATLLVTADEPLANAARSRGLRVWNCLRQPMPTC